MKNKAINPIHFSKFLVFLIVVAGSPAQRIQGQREPENTGRDHHEHQAPE